MGVLLDTYDIKIYTQAELTHPNLILIFHTIPPPPQQNLEKYSLLTQLRNITAYT